MAGRTIKTQTKVAKLSAHDEGTGQQVFPATVADRYAPRVYARSMAYDAADRAVEATTGAAELRRDEQPLVPEVLDASCGSSCSTSCSRRGTVKKAGSSYGSLITSIERTADGLVKQLAYGDAADTRTAYLYDERRRISSVQTYRGPPTSGAANWNGQFPASSDATADEPTRQLVLQDEDFRYDVVGNPIETRDWRDPRDWPDGAKPVTKKITYDDLYRAVDVRSEYSEGDDTWTSPFAAEVDTDPNNEDSRRAQPSPHVEFEKRILRQTFEYDWLGNNETTTDDAGGFYDRSLGEIENGAPAGADAGSDQKPYQLKGASLAEGHSPGSLQARYDDAGYMTGMVLQRGGPCLVPGVGLSSPEACNQRFVYEWDEVGRLSRARRWDNNTSTVDGAVPGEKPAADLRYNYDASDQRVLKEAVDQNDNKSFTVYVFSTLELRRAQWSDDPTNGGGEGGALDYEANEWTVVPYLLANGVRLARVAYEPDAPKILESETSETEAGYVSQHQEAGGSLHVLFELGDHLGSTSVVLDKATGELVERSTFQAYGGSESDYRPERWGAFREDHKFTGKEEDVEVGLQYFGKRYLNAQLGRWISADPLAVHAPGEADANLYAYVSGAVLRNVDPVGLKDEAALGQAAGAAANASSDSTSAMASSQAAAGAMSESRTNAANARFDAFVNEAMSEQWEPLDDKEAERVDIKIEFQLRLMGHDEWNTRKGVPIEPTKPIAGLVVHHMASKNVARQPDPRQHARNLSRSTQRDHIAREGSKDSLQHFMITRDGVIVESRRGSVDAIKQGEIVRGGHGGKGSGVNQDHIGVETEGNYVGNEEKLTPEARAAWRSLNRFIGIHRPGPVKVVGHKEVHPTQCPANLMDYKNGFANEINTAP